MENIKMQIPDGWKYSKLDVAIKNISDGGTPSRTNDLFYNGKIPWVVINDIKDEIVSTKESLTEFGLASCSSKLWDVGTVILSTGATIGKVGVLGVSSATKQGICGIELKTGFDNKYIMYLLKTYHSKFNAYAQGSTIREIRPKLIKELEFIFPKSLTEQKKIAQILSTVDKAIEQTEQLIAKYERIKTGLMQDLLTKGIDENGNIRSEETHEFKESGLGRIPIEWECLSLIKCMELHNRLRKPISAIEREKIIGTYPYYGATGVIDRINKYSVDGEFVLFGEDGDHFLKWSYQEQTILVNGKFNVSNHAHIVKGNEKCSTEWIHHFFMHRDITFYLTRQGAGRFKLNKDAISVLPILVPKNTKEIENISSKINGISKLIQDYSDKRKKLQRLKTALMQDLLSGKKRVNSIINYE